MKKPGPTQIANTVFRDPRSLYWGLRTLKEQFGFSRATMDEHYGLLKECGLLLLAPLRAPTAEEIASGANPHIPVIKYEEMPEVEFDIQQKSGFRATDPDKSAARALQARLDAPPFRSKLQQHYTRALEAMFAGNLAGPGTPGPEESGLSEEKHKNLALLRRAL